MERPSALARFLDASKDVVEVRIAPEGTPAANHAFDVTPARLVTGLISERGICPATREGIAALYPDLAGAPAGGA